MNDSLNWSNSSGARGLSLMWTIEPIENAASILCVDCTANAPPGTEPACVASKCQFPCAAGFHLCAGTCSPDTDANSCGSRCDPCPVPENGSAVCVARACDFTCDLGRGAAENPLFLVNHWIKVDPPSRAVAKDANGREVLLARGEECEAARGRRPNILAVDFYADGDLFDVVDTLNGVAPS